MFQNMTTKGKLATILVISFILHLVATLFLSHLGDPEYWPRIMQTVNSGNGIYGLDGNYYTPIWGYLLSFVDMVIQTFGLIPFFGDVFESLLPLETTAMKAWIVSPEIALATKMPMVICDLIVGYILFKIVSDFTKSENKGLTAAAMWCFCPIVIYMSSVQGQFDTISTLLFLLTVQLLREDRSLLAGLSFGLAVWLKLFPGVCLLLFVAYLFARYDNAGAIKRTVMAAVGALIVTIILLTPQFLNGEMDIVFGFFTGRMNTVTEYEWYNTLVSVRLTLMMLSMIVLMVWSFIGMKRRTEDLDRYLYLYGGTLLAAATIISRGYQYAPSFMAPIILFAMISDDRRSYGKLFSWMSILLIIDAFFSVGPSLLAMASVYFGVVDPAWLSDISVAFLTTIGYSSSMPPGVVTAIAWAVMLWLFVLYAVSDLFGERYPRFRAIAEKMRIMKEEPE